MSIMNYIEIENNRYIIKALDLERIDPRERPIIC